MKKFLLVLTLGMIATAAYANTIEIMNTTSYPARGRLDYESCGKNDQSDATCGEYAIDFFINPHSKTPPIDAPCPAESRCIKVDLVVPADEKPKSASLGDITEGVYEIKLYKDVHELAIIKKR